MITDNTLLVFVIVGALALLIILQFALAVRHDRAVAAAGPIEELAVYEKRLEEKQRLLDDLEEELAKRREAMAVAADIGAEVDGLRRQKEELLAEWNAMAEKRDEVQAMRREIEDVVIERQSLEAEIAPLRAEYLEVKERLKKAEELVHRIDALTAEHERLSAQVEGMRDELEDLGARVKTEHEALASAQAEHARIEAQTAAETLELRRQQGELQALADSRSAMETEASRLEGRITSLNDALDELGARVTTEREVLTAAKAEHARIEAQAAAENLELRRQQGELQALAESRSAMEARLAYLEGEIAKSEGRTPDDKAGEDDKLRELRELPPAIRTMIDWPEAEPENETDAIKRVQRRLLARGLHYPSRTLHAFHTAMKVNETTQMAVLAGISGTGKSQLPRQYAAGMGIGFLQVPVQPRWDSPQDLMGFYNYIEGKFRPTDMARALWALDEVNNKEGAVQDRMMMILLDEMNLARVEYYFSDFLSRLESRPSPADVDEKNERKDAEIELEIPNLQDPPRIFPGYNLLFAGTMNEDESTQSLSDKVVDRANVLRFSAPKTINTVQPQGEVPEIRALSRTRWRGWVRPVSSVSGEARVQGAVETMVALMKEFKRPIGHRLGRAIMAYVANYPNAEGTRPIDDALADQVEMRLLPKLRGVDVELAATTFGRLGDFVGRELGDETLAEAIAASVQASEDSGQFGWSGVTR